MMITFLSLLFFPMVVIMKDNHVVFQFVIRRSSPAGDGRITRVVTHRLPVTDDGRGFLQVWLSVLLRFARMSCVCPMFCV